MVDPCPTCHHGVPYINDGRGSFQALIRNLRHREEDRQVEGLDGIELSLASLFAPRSGDAQLALWGDG